MLKRRDMLDGKRRPENAVERVLETIGWSIVLVVMVAVVVVGGIGDFILGFGPYARRYYIK